MDRKYLDWHGQQWRVRVKVPELARAVLGKHKLVVPLRTDSLANANRLKHRIVADLQDQIAKALVEARRRSRTQPDPLIEEAFAWRGQIDRERELPEVGGPHDTGAADVLPDRAEELERTHGPDRAATFYNVAMGLATPVASLIDAWMAERADMKPRQQSDYRRAVTRFAAWLAEAKLSGAIEAVDRKAAGRYVTEAMVAKGQHWKTSNKDISALSGYWKWLVDKGYCGENVWARQSRRKVKTKGDARKPRPFTDAEIVALFAGVPEDDPPLRDAMFIGALSGMRIEEIARLTVAGCAGGLFRVSEAKTEAGVRDVPIHPDLRELVVRRTTGKAGTAYLLHELRDPPPGSLVERGQVLTKRFITLRRRLGVDDRVPGQRQSRVTFHSLRRWFSAAARAAFQRGVKGFDPWTIADVLGHDPETVPDGLAMTMGRYAGPASLDARKACVAAVRLPRRAVSGRATKNTGKRTRGVT